MSYKDRKLNASFRGAAFKVEEAGLDTGRKTKEHAHPKYNKTYVEDVSKKSRAYSFTAFVIGDDYDIQRDKLITACEKAGAGLLIHPNYGEFKAICTSCSVRDKGRRYAEISLSFVEKVEHNLPKNSTDKQTAFDYALKTAIAEEIETFKKNFNVSNSPGFVQKSITSALSQIQEKAQLAANFNVSDMNLTESLEVGDISSSIQNTISNLGSGCKKLQNITFGENVPFMTPVRVSQNEQLQHLQKYTNNLAYMYEGVYLTNG